MTEQKHTPLPWYAVRNSRYWDINIENYRYGQTLASTQVNRELGIDEDIEKANAQFIVRACNVHYDLVAALKRLTPPMPEPDAACHNGIVPQDQCGNCRRIRLAHEALAKAKGEN